MKKKTINAILTKKINEWIESIDDEEIRQLVKNNTIVTGGCIASMLLKEKVNDYDLYFKNRHTAEAVANHYIALFKPQINSKVGKIDIYVDRNSTHRVKIVIRSVGIASEKETEQPYDYFEGSARAEDAGDYVSEVIQDPGTIADTYEETEEAALETEDEGKPKYRPVFMSTNAITLSNRIQLIFRFYGEPDDIHKNYDFVHCTNYWTMQEGVVLRQDALESLLARELRYVGSRYPICSLIRLRKFIRRNWTINAGQILKMAMQVSELNLRDIRVLEDQLTGVDVAYFLELISKLKEKDPEKVNAAYLVEIIDRMF